MTEQNAQDETAQELLHPVNGVLVPPIVTQELVDVLQAADYYPDDVWIATYPKTGTLWTAQIVRLIHSKGVQDDTVLPTVVPWLENSDLNFKSDLPVEKMPRPRAFRSHFPYASFPTSNSPHSMPSKFIYVMRNPKDVVVSYFKFLKLGIYPDLQWDQFWKMFMAGYTPYGDYFDHILSWWAHRDSPNILFMKYEDIKKDLLQAVSKIASFLEVDLSPDVIQKIAELTTFEKMKTDKTANFSWYKMFNNKRGRPEYLRKGTVGDWTMHLSAEESAAVDKKCQEKFAGTGIEFIYK